VSSGASSISSPGKTTVHATALVSGCLSENVWASCFSVICRNFNSGRCWVRTSGLCRVKAKLARSRRLRWYPVSAFLSQKGRYRRRGRPPSFAPVVVKLSSRTLPLNLYPPKLARTGFCEGGDEQGPPVDERGVAPEPAHTEKLPTVPAPANRTVRQPRPDCRAPGCRGGERR
jgi:hypothetical protein